MSNSQVLKVFKNLLNSTSKTFKGDLKLLKEAKIEIRKRFNENKKEENPDKIKELVAIATQAEIIIRQNLVQAIEKKDKPGHFGNLFVYSELNITKDTEINENETIKSSCGQPAQAKH